MTGPADASWEEQRRHLARIVDTSDDAIVSKTTDGVIRSWNRGAERMFGWSADEAVGRHITLIIPEDRHAEEEDVLARIRRGEMIDHFETVRLTKDGRRLQISLTVSPVTDAQGRVIGASKIARDITERRQLEHERDGLLAREQKARAIAEEASRAKDALLATVSHELRTPLTSLLGYVRMLQTRALTEEQRHAFEVINRSGAGLANIIDDLLDFSRLATGRMRMTFEACELAKLVGEAVDTVRPSAAAKGLKIDSVVQPDWPVSGDPDRLRQLIWNLLMNAIKFTPTGGQIHVAAVRHAGSVELTVADSGIGISREVLPHVFEAFRQEDSSTTRSHAGLGLGLALVKQIAELHGGDVRAWSEGRDKGARFTVQIPLIGSMPDEATRCS